jgi:hypothetical protein
LGIRRFLTILRGFFLKKKFEGFIGSELNISWLSFEAYIYRTIRPSGGEGFADIEEKGGEGVGSAEETPRARSKSHSLDRIF